jgi:PAS domain S-box-containing protein
LNANITMTNQRAARILEYERTDEIIGRSGFDFIVPEDWARARENIQQVFETGLVRDIEYTLLKKMLAQISNGSS